MKWNDITFRDWVAVISAVAASMSVVAASVAALIAWLNSRFAIKEAARNTTKGEFSTRKRATIDFLIKWISECLCLPLEIKKMKDKLTTAKNNAKDGISHELWRLQTTLFSIWEIASTGINSGAFDIDVLDRMTGSRILAHYKDNAKFVRKRRRDEGMRSYDQLDIVIDRLLEMRYSPHRITEKTHQQLREAHVDSAIIKRLKGLPKVYESDKKLALTLADHGIEAERNLISEFSRLRCFSVVKCIDHHHKKKAVELFADV